MFLGRVVLFASSRLDTRRPPLRGFVRVLCTSRLSGDGCYTLFGRRRPGSSVLAAFVRGWQLPVSLLLFLVPWFGSFGFSFNFPLWLLLRVGTEITALASGFP